MTYLLVFKPSISGEWKYLQRFFSFQTHWLKWKCLTNVIVKGEDSILIGLSFPVSSYSTHESNWVLTDRVRRKLCFSVWFLHFLVCCVLVFCLFKETWKNRFKVSKTDPDGNKELKDTYRRVNLSTDIIEPCKRILWNVHHVWISLIVCHTSVGQWIFVRLLFCCCFLLV